MATAIFAGASWDNGTVFMNAQYDTVSLLVTGVDYQNLSPIAASVTFYGPSNVSRAFTIPANTPETSLNVSSANIHLQQNTFVSPKSGQQQTIVALPTGWTMSFNWPT